MEVWKGEGRRTTVLWRDHAVPPPPSWFNKELLTPNTLRSTSDSEKIARAHSSPPLSLLRDDVFSCQWAWKGTNKVKKAVHWRN